jgi:hypothetical protein
MVIIGNVQLRVDVMSGRNIELVRVSIRDIATPATQKGAAS